jgi:hypothetical protein
MMSMKIPKAAMAPVKAEEEKLKKVNVYFYAFVDYLKLCFRERKQQFIIVTLFVTFFC